jgi:hypothetical protein
MRSEIVDWLPRRVRRGDLFVTGSKTPYELRWRSPLGAEMDEIHIHLGRRRTIPRARTWPMADDLAEPQGSTS